MWLDAWNAYVLQEQLEQFSYQTKRNWRPPYKHNFQIHTCFHCWRRATVVVAGQRQPLSPGSPRVALGRAGRNNVFRTSSPFLFNIEPNKKPRSEFPRRVDLEDISCIFITDAESGVGGWATCRKRWNREWRVQGWRSAMVSSSSSSSSSLATFAWAWLQETMQPSAAPQEMWNTDIKQKVNLTAPTGDVA